jgi:hypothetical protein
MEKIDMEVSSTTLGNPKEEGKIGAISGLFQNKEKYTQTVINNAGRFQTETEKIMGEEKVDFGVSILASSVNPQQIKQYISSIDYPYKIDWDIDFLKEKVGRAKREGYKGLGIGIGVAQELAYAFLQSNSNEQQMSSTYLASEMIENSPVKIRTSIEMVTLEEELRKIKEVNSKIKDKSKDVIWVIEPNEKVGEGTLSDFLTRLDHIREGNRDLKFGVDLDLGGLPNEQRDLITILERLNASEQFPLLISLSGREYTEGGIKSHLPLRNDEEYNSSIGEWFKNRLARGLKIPGIVIETSPADKPLMNYKEFLKAFKRGIN